MSEFQKGLLLGIMLMGLMFLFTAQTPFKENKEIAEYAFVRGTKNVNNAMNDWGYVPYGSPFALGNAEVQAMVKYK